ncbi:hypothetical protein M231_01683 [Tremella mesenterica]|uniref:Cupin type-1 domain-containing protein n=1 Tax=Tremella mesenterica TaxID=5217 RepID=A0A4Q1BT19_TREME|nr:hypothetical protein M231_01683 [Tremella mesenterica]
MSDERSDLSLLVKADAITKALHDESHPLYPKSKTSTAPISDMAGMKDLGVHFVKLEPDAESTCIHWHLVDSEWIYVLSGFGVLQVVDAGIPDWTSKEEMVKAIMSPKSDEKPKIEIVEHVISTGDFMGFSGGVGAQKHAHGLKAGKDGMTYLVGGTRSGKDVCYYPLDIGLRFRAGQAIARHSSPFHAMFLPPGPTPEN